MKLRNKTLASEMIQTHCEQKFQKGYPNVQMTCDGENFVSSTFTASQALKYAPDGWSVYARRKIRGKDSYVWFLIGTK